jgi:tRNA (guanine-N7-)-methyltransferase
MRRGGRLPLEVLQPYLLDLPGTKSKGALDGTLETAEPLDWQQVFGNDRDVEIEVGFGKGLFLLTASQAHPQINYLGIEIDTKYQLYTATRLAKRQIANVRVLCADARVVFRAWVRAESVTAVHVYFPDPWWKKRHRKRRVFSDDFAALCARVLKPSGRLHVATDVEEYFGEIEALLGAQPTLRKLPPPPARQPEHDLDYLTNFERKYRKEAKPIFRADYERK